MSDEVLLEASLQKPAMAQAVGCLVSIPILFGVVVVMNLFIGDSDLPREIRGTTPYFVLATLLTGALAAWVWQRSRFRLAVVEKEGVKYLEIYDPSAPLVLQEPFELVYGWNTLHMPKAGTMKLVIVGIYQEGELQLSLTETWGTIYSPPVGWPRDFALHGTAKAAYTAGGTSFLVDLVNLLED